jgi:hypothetical protein
MAWGHLVTGLGALLTLGSEGAGLRRLLSRGTTTGSYQYGCLIRSRYFALTGIDGLSGSGLEVSIVRLRTSSAEPATVSFLGKANKSGWKIPL